jgi:hypothetical protein
VAGSRGNGEVSIYQRTSDGRWLGVVTLGRDGTGRIVRKAVSAKTRAEVVRKLKKPTKRSRRRAAGAGYEDDRGSIAHPLAR